MRCAGGDIDEIARPERETKDVGVLEKHGRAPGHLSQYTVTFADKKKRLRSIIAPQVELRIDVR